jgi:hypothetical protein
MAFELEERSSEGCLYLYFYNGQESASFAGRGLSPLQLNLPGRARYNTFFYRWVIKGRRCWFLLSGCSESYQHLCRTTMSSLNLRISESDLTSGV